MIEGNTNIKLQLNTGEGENEIGETIPSWETVDKIDGFLDLSSGDSKYNTFRAKIQESTHVFVSDYKKLDSRIKPENSRAVDKDGCIYDVLLIDDPMKLHKQLEIYLKYIGGQ